MPELAVVAPTYNELENVAPFLEALKRALDGIDYEVIFVDDDSPDGTADLVRSISRHDPRVRIVHRINRRGLASAAVEGALISSAPYIAIMDADLQHDERVLPLMLKTLETKKLDLVIGSRNVKNGCMGDFSAHRVKLSMFGRALSGIACKAELSDPMSGYFIVTRQFFNEVVRSLSNRGFKILVDIVASAERPVQFEEVGYTFRNRAYGESKLDFVVGIEYVELLLDKTLGHIIPVSYILFAAVGSFGRILHVAAVALLVDLAQLSFATAQIIASSIVVNLNFAINNYLTFRKARLRGMRQLGGAILFYAGCAVGLFTNVQISEILRANGIQWYFASAFGLFVGSVWNYWVSEIFVWRVNVRRQRSRMASSQVPWSSRVNPAISD